MATNNLPVIANQQHSDWTSFNQNWPSLQQRAAVVPPQAASLPVQAPRQPVPGPSMPAQAVSMPPLAPRASQPPPAGVLQAIAPPATNGAQVVHHRAAPAQGHAEKRSRPSAPAAEGPSRRNSYQRRTAPSQENRSPGEPMDTTEGVPPRRDTGVPTSNTSNRVNQDGRLNRGEKRSRRRNRRSSLNGQRDLPGKARDLEKKSQRPASRKPAPHREEKSRRPAPAARRVEKPSSQPVRTTGMVYSSIKRATITSTMLPSDEWWISQGEVHYQGDLHKCKFPALLPEETLLRRKPVVHPVRPTLVVDSMWRPSLPKPSPEMPETMQSNPWLYLSPRVKPCTSHVDNGRQCACTRLGLAGQFHRPAVLPEACLRTGFLKPAEMAVKPLELQLSENSSRVYLLLDKEDDHQLALPTPFPISGQWPGVLYEPAMARVKEDDLLRLYFALFDSERFREMGQIYLQPPQAWPEDRHPTFGEPSPTSELGRVVQSLYGVETLQRTGLCAHPCAEPRINLYCAVSNFDRTVPVYVTDRASPLRLEAVITEVIRPWYDQGLGKILCSVCLVQTSAEKGTTLLLLSRSEYIRHWESSHVPDMVASTTFSSTQLHCRVHMGHIAYVLALANRRRGKEKVSEKAFSDSALAQFGITERSDVLKDFLGPPTAEEYEENLDLMIKAL